ncbi:MAG: indolepyruvate oxidoreductase subunit beta [candidate division WOR-3 bacterium]
MNTINIIICGIGGQGVLLLSDILGEVAMENGFLVKKSEVKGMAQRGGSVISHLRFGEEVYSPLIPLKEADFLLSMEKLEALRYLDYLKEDGILITDNFYLPPLPVLIGENEFDSNIIDKNLKERVKNLYYVPAQNIAKELGDVRVSNIILLGFLSNFLDFKLEDYFKVLERNIKKEYLEINKKAFQKGREFFSH